jgi:Ca2+-transporting ATPase
VPFLQKLFHFSTLHVNDLAICLAGGFVSVIWFEGLKMLRQKSQK